MQRAGQHLPGPVAADMSNRNRIACIGLRILRLANVAYPVVPGPPISGGSPAGGSPATEGWFWLTVLVLPRPSCRIPVAVFLRRGMRLGVPVPLRGFVRVVMSR